MDRHDAAGARCDGALDQSWVDVVRARADVHEHRLRAEPRDDAGGRKETVRRGDDFVAGLDVERHERHEQSVGAGGHADAVGALRISGDSFLQRLDVRAEDEMLRIAHLVDGAAHVVADRGVLGFEIKQGYLHGFLG